MEILQIVNKPGKSPEQFSETGYGYDNNPEEFPEEQFSIEELRRRLEQYSGTHSESEDIAQYAEAGGQYLWYGGEVEYETEEFDFWFKFLGDRNSQWWMLMSNAFNQGGRETLKSVCFSEEYVLKLMSQLDDFIESEEMRKSGIQSDMTIRIDDYLIRRAEKFSEKVGMPVSKVVADYFATLNLDPLQPWQIQR